MYPQKWHDCWYICIPKWTQIIGIEVTTVITMKMEVFCFSFCNRIVNPFRSHDVGWLTGFSSQQSSGLAVTVQISCGAHPPTYPVSIRASSARVLLQGNTQIYTSAYTDLCNSALLGTCRTLLYLFLLTEDSLPWSFKMTVCRLNTHLCDMLCHWFSNFVILWPLK